MKIRSKPLKSLTTLCGSMINALSFLQKNYQIINKGILIDNKSL